MLDLALFGPQFPLIVLDVANNHNGSVEHGQRIIDSLEDCLKLSRFKIAIKFQYRDLDTFIHPDFRGRRDLKYVDRFLSTRLKWDEYEELTQYAKSAGFLTSATPFDENSVGWVEGHKHDFLKIASASFSDWPLLERIADSDLPIVASTAGATQTEIDRVVSFLQNRHKSFALMHCVAAYPTADDDLVLDRIDVIRDRYEGVQVGYSTHEDPENFIAGAMALAKGAAILERHVGSSNDGSTLNAYSSDSQIIRTWLTNLEDAIRMLGGAEKLNEVNASEMEALRGLRRGVFAKEPLKSGSRVTEDAVFYAIPLRDGQVSANEFSKYLNIGTKIDLLALTPVLWGQSDTSDQGEELRAIVSTISRFVSDSGVHVPAAAEMELSHHYGLENFANYGMSMITIINREYCKKLLILLPGQSHPEQWHNVKEETFHTLHGNATLVLDGVEQDVAPGDVVVVERGVRHSFSSASGCIIEEISTRHEGSDSFYTDDVINRNKARKTIVRFWRTLD
jgi:sialic acid synthase SpsE/mannose-6-phosphate isomerase-like protein (cupin superfamily)